MEVLINTEDHVEGKKIKFHKKNYLSTIQRDTLI
jgi:hypothetical protein